MTIANDIATSTNDETDHDDDDIPLSQLSKPTSTDITDLAHFDRWLVTTDEANTMHTIVTHLIYRWKTARVTHRGNATPTVNTTE